jgi:hypothetical protein
MMPSNASGDAKIFRRIKGKPRFGDPCDGLKRDLKLAPLRKRLSNPMYHADTRDESDLQTDNGIRFVTLIGGGIRGISKYFCS